MTSSTEQLLETPDAGIIATEILDSSVPANYVLEIDSFSMLASNNIDEFESNEFYAGGYKWKLILYPEGDNHTNNCDHISIHVALSNKDSLKVGEQIYATVRFSVFDQVHAKYFTKQGGAEMFNRMKLGCGISDFMSLETFTDPSNGYLVDDKCMFGVGIFVIKSSGLGDSLSLNKNPPTHLHEWKITKFSKLASKLQDKEYVCSTDFRVGNYKWCLILYPKGNNCEDHLSLFLKFHEDYLAPGQKVRATFTIRLKGRYGIVHTELDGAEWFSSLSEWGWNEYMSLKDFKKYSLDDCCTIEAQVAVLAEVKKLV